MRYFTTPKVILGTDGLARTEGFWSGNEVLVCTSKTPTIHLLNKQTTTSDLIQAIESHIDGILRDLVLEEYLCSIAAYDTYFESGFKNLTKACVPIFCFTKIPKLQRPEFIGKGNKWKSPRWQDILSSLRAKGKTDDEIAAFLTDSWIDHYRKNTPTGVNCQNGVPGQTSLFLVNWCKMGASMTPEEFLQTLWCLTDIDFSSARFLGRERSSAYRFLTNKENFTKLIADITDTEWQLLKKFGGDSFMEHSTSNAYAFLNLPRAAAAALAILHKEGYVLTNSGALSGRMAFACAVMGMFNQYLLKHPGQQSSALQVITSTTVRKVEDVPANLPDLLIQVSGQSISGFMKTLLMNYPTEENGLLPFDLSRFTRSKSNKNENEIVSTPEWFHANGYGNDWVEFCRIALEVAKGGEGATKGTLSRIADWVGQRFNSPWDIKPVDLRDPSKPKNSDTFFSYISKRNNLTNANFWSSSARLFKLAANYLNTPGYPGYQEGVRRVNPFKNIENPFRKPSRSGNKTHRSRISTVLHDKLIEVILSPDENGKPTFQWAQENSRKHFSSTDFLPDGTWCPSRWTALAVLLLLPPRKKQVRWMDQGLMDEFVFDPDTFTMVENTHNLRNFRYKDGQSHLTRYGRNSGAIQPITDSFMGVTEHLGIFINTNKTQLWNPKRRNGYELPWPDGSELLKSDDPEVQEQGRWLRQVYEVLAFQYKSVQEHDPDPIPVTFSDVSMDRKCLPGDPDIHESLPCFVPLFRDFTTKETLKRNGTHVYATLPISGRRIEAGFLALCMEVERLLKAEGFEHVQLTIPNDTKAGREASEGTVLSRKLKFDIHCLRVAGISRLIEMDIDPTIVQEFVAGHLTPAMTHRYLKLTPWHVREKIIEAIVNGNMKSAMDTWAENISKGKGEENVAQGFVSAPRFREYVADFPDDYARIAPVSGGICIMGGMGDACKEGGVYEREIPNKDEAETVFGPVQGGCGNCRFFKTAPFLIIEQSLYLDILMDDLRAMAGERKKLRTKITDFECQIADCTETKSRHSLVDKKTIHKARLESLNHSMVPMVTEWVNRYMMLQDCQKMIDENLEGQPELALVSTFGSSVGLSAEDLKVEIEQTTELGLAGRIVEKARILEGRGIAIPSKPAMMLQRSVDIILRSIDSPYLLLDVSEDQVGRAASMLHNALVENFGAEAIEQTAKKNVPLALGCFQKEQINALASAVISASNKGRLSIENVLKKASGCSLIKGANV